MLVFAHVSTQSTGKGRMELDWQDDADNKWAANPVS